jgi:hypothetical protein
MAERQLTRKELGARYAVARTTIYNWVQQRVFPEADVRYSNKSLWSEARLARWERRHLRLLASQGVDIDKLQRLWALPSKASQIKTKSPRREAGRRKDQPKASARHKPVTSSSCQGREVAADVFAVLAKARGLLMSAMARSRQLTQRERSLAVSHLKQALVLLGR